MGVKILSCDRKPWLLAGVLCLILTLWSQPTAAAPQATCEMREVDGQSVGEVLVNGEVALRIRVAVGEFDVDERCQQVVDRVNELLSSKGITDPRPDVSDGQVIVREGSTTLVTVTDDAARLNQTSRSYLAWQWANNMRKALNIELLGEDAIPVSSISRFKRLTASWYGQAFAGRRTASGEPFVPEALTAAHRTLPFNTLLRVVNPATGAQAIVRVNDRGPWVGGRELDLSWGAAAKIGLVSSGVGQVLVEVLRLGDGSH